MRTKNLFLLYIFIEMIIGAIAIAWHGYNLEALHTITRFSGRLSLVFFSLMILLANKDWKSRVISDFPYLLFAVIHGIHLGELLFYVSLANAPLVPIRLLGGFVAYVVIFVTAFVHTRYATGRELLMIVFKRVKVVFYPYIWFMFFMAYLPRVLRKATNAGGAYWEHVLFFAWVILVAVIALSNRKQFVTAQHV